MKLVLLYLLYRTTLSETLFSITYQINIQSLQSVLFCTVLFQVIYDAVINQIIGLLETTICKFCKQTTRKTEIICITLFYHTCYIIFIFIVVNLLLYLILSEFEGPCIIGILQDFGIWHTSLRVYGIQRGLVKSFYCLFQLRQNSQGYILKRKLVFALKQILCVLCHMQRLRKTNKDIYIKWDMLIMWKRNGKVGMGRKILKDNKAVNTVKEHFTHLEFSQYAGKFYVN